MITLKNILDCINHYSDALTFILGVVAFSVAWWQIGIVKRNIQISSCKNESDIFMNLDEKYNSLYDAMCTYHSTEEENKEILEKQIDNLRRIYFNALDTVCFYVLKGGINKETFYSRYDDIFLEFSKKAMYKDYFENKEGYYENISKVVADLRKRYNKQIKLVSLDNSQEANPQEVKPKPIQDFAILHNASAMQKDLFISLQQEIEKFCEFSPIEHKTRIAIKGSGRSNICVYESKKTINGFEISFNLNKNEFFDPRDLVIDTEHIGVYGKRSSVFLTNLDDVEYVANLIKQSYEKK